MGHPIVEADSPPIQRTDEGGIYGRLLTIDRGPRTKYIASKHPRPKYYTILHLRVAYAVSTLRITLLQPPYKTRPAIC